MICFVSGSNSVVRVSTIQINMSAFKEQKAMVHIFLAMWMLTWIQTWIPQDYNIVPLQPQQQWICWFHPNLAPEKREPRTNISRMEGEILGFFNFFFFLFSHKNIEQWVQIILLQRRFAFMVLGLSWNNQQCLGKISGHAVSHADLLWVVVFHTSLYRSVLVCFMSGLQDLRGEVELENLTALCLHIAQDKDSGLQH